MDLLKTVTARMITGIIALAVVAIGISWWRMDDSTRQMLVDGAGKIVSWLLIVLLVPWVSFFLIAWVARRNSNAAGAALVASYTIAEAILLAWLFHWSVPGATAWTFLVAGALFAGVYNLLTCDWLAEKLL
jgi:hypothetical protein